MAVVVVGGHSRDVGKTSVVAGIISSLPEMRWTAAKITQYGHGVCSVNGEGCECASDEHTQAISEEHSHLGDSDTSRFLLAGAERVFWVRTKQGWLAEAMPALRQRLAGAANVILESNSVLRFLRPDLYISVLNFDNPDFKDSAREFLDRADAIVWHGNARKPQWSGVSRRLFEEAQRFEVRPPDYRSEELLGWLKRRLAAPATQV